MFKNIKDKIIKGKFIREFLISTVFPVFISIFFSEATDGHFSPQAKIIIGLILVAINGFLLFWQYRNSNQERQEVLNNKINTVAYTNAHQLSERKRDYIVLKSYEEKYSLTKEVIPYNVLEYISEICRNFRDTISQITSIPQEHMSVTFIYHYDYNGATEDDRSWRWVVGKEFSTRTALDKFIERETSLYNYLINGEDGKVNSIFCNDKKDLAYKGHYYMSPRDKEHNKIGSVFAVKVMFGNNGGNFVEGVLLVSSYGKRFVEKDSKYTEEELRIILFEELYPYYQRLLEAELGMQYLKHDKNKECKSEKIDRTICECHSCCRKTDTKDEEVEYSEEL